MITLDRERSTVTLGGRTFPACVLICPPTPDRDESEMERALGSIGGANLDHNVYVPLENGALVSLESYGPGDPDRAHLLEVTIRARTCELYDLEHEPLFLPYAVTLIDGHLEVRTDIFRGTWWWPNAEEEWAVEHLLRLSTLPLTVTLPGPSVRLVPLSYFENEVTADA